VAERHPVCNSPSAKQHASPTTTVCPGAERADHQDRLVNARHEVQERDTSRCGDIIGGPNNQEIAVTTNSEGIANTAYVGRNAGKDIVTATASISGLQEASNNLIVPWAVPAAPQPAPGSSSNGSEPPSVEILRPEGNSVITGPQRVTGKIAGEVTTWSLALTPADGNAITLASGSGVPSSQSLATIEPAALGGGTYTLALQASSSGGSETETEPLTIGTTPGIPPPAPARSEGGAPTLSDITPANDSVIGVTTPLTAKATAPEGQTISGWTVTLQPRSGGPVTTLAESTAEHPAPVAVIELIYPHFPGVIYLESCGCQQGEIDAQEIHTRPARPGRRSSGVLSDPIT
jgi:hypothetical protein